MQLRRYNPITLAAVLLVSVSLALAAQPSSPSASSSSHTVVKKSKTHHSAKKSRRTRGQQAIDGERTRQIQEALIREHYLSGAPSGKWDDSTQVALRRYQADQGWQSKLVPDSRALIRLGLGPDHDHLLNPESAMTTAPVSRNSGQHVRPASHGTSTASTSASGNLPVANTPATVTNVGSVPELSPSR